MNDRLLFRIGETGISDNHRISAAHEIETYKEEPSCLNRIPRTVLLTFQKAWRGFQGAKWTDEVNVREFIQNNYTQYDGNEDFLAAPTEATDKLWGRLQELQKEERKRRRFRV